MGVILISVLEMLSSKSLFSLILSTLLVSVVVAKPVDTIEDADDSVHTMECRGTVSSSCQGTQCLVICSTGEKLELECEEGLNVNSDQLGGVSMVEVSCGAQVKFAPCFPFCASGQEKVDQPHKDGHAKQNQNDDNAKQTHSDGHSKQAHNDDHATQHHKDDHVKQTHNDGHSNHVSAPCFPFCNANFNPSPNYHYNSYYNPYQGYNYQYSPYYQTFPFYNFPFGK